MTNSNRVSNRLINEKSPYLLQHAHNPVDWYPWSDEAFQKANNENKPIFLSIGYSTCHWCHVMERESFEDEEVAEYLNREFVAIKVDKEERPDIDAIYMGVCQVLTGQGGWPLTIIMTPEQKPFFAGTYFPKQSRYQMPGLMDILKGVSSQWKSKKEELISSGEEITAHIRKNQFADNAEERTEITKEIILKAKHQFEHGFDKNFGGFYQAPKFPTPHNLMFLLRYAYLEKDDKSLHMVEKTLEQMYQGGIFDHIGFGFSRYSTDQKWLVPHFEKMLYDNALLAIIYLETYQLTKKDLYKRVSEKILEYVRRELTSEDGGFYCAQDADSEGIEGKYYVFTPDEIQKVLGNEDGKYFNEYFDITKQGNFEGRSIPNLIGKIDFDQWNQRIEELCDKVYNYRLERTKLHKDDKILTSWNALMICAFAKAYKILGEEKYLQVAKRAIQFTKDKLTMEGGRLKVRYRDEDAAGKGNIDDYAFFSWALLEMYEATFDVGYLAESIGYVGWMLDLFFDERYGGFYLYAKDAEKLIFRPKEVYDGAIPSGNSVAAYVLIRLAKLTGDPKLEELAAIQMEFIAGNINDYPSGYSFSLMALLMVLYPSREVIVTAKRTEDKKEFQQLVRKLFVPDAVFILKDRENSDRLSSIAEYTKDYEIDDENPTIYVCKNQSCMAPFCDIKQLEQTLSKI